jgi:hypothetical protein
MPIPSFTTLPGGGTAPPLELLDLAAQYEAARAAVAEDGLAERCEVVGGDFFEAVPPGGDGYCLSWIIHDWDDERAVAILRSVRRAIAPEGRLLLIESVIPDDDRPDLSLIQDGFLLPLGGVERTGAEYSALPEAAGFRLERIVPTLCPQSIVEAVPV